MRDAPQRAEALPRAFVAVCVLGPLSCLAFGGAVSLTSDADARALITTACLLVFGAAAGLSAFRRMRTTVDGRRRRAWFTVALGLCLGFLANAIGLALDMLGWTEWLGLVDALLIAALLACVAALTLFPPTPRRGTDLARLILDGLVVGGSVLFVASVTIFPTLLAGRDDSPISELQVLALPVLDLVITTFATLMITRSGTASRAPLQLLGSAFLLYAVSDMAYAVNVSKGAAALGSWWDLGWLGGYLLVCLAALHPDAGHHPEPAAEESSSLVSTLVCLSIFLCAAGTSMAVDIRGDMYAAPRVVWGMLICVVVLRQVALVLDNEQLRRSLETRVSERTKQLHHITRQRELLLASVADGIYGVDRAGLITMVNSATTRLLQRPESELVGADAHELFHAPQRDGTQFPKAGCYITEAISSGLTATGEDDIYLRGDGKEIVVEATASPLTGENGITGAVVVFRDVSQRREMDRMKQEFISFVSHELRTPLTSIRGALGLIAGGALGQVPPKAARMIDIASSGSIRLGRLVNDILDIERLDSGMLPLTIAAHDAAPMCREAIAATSGMAHAAGITLVCGPASGRVLADRDRLVQVLINLLGNAVRFSDPGDRVVVDVRTTGDAVQFAVTDTGCGIPADKLDAVFGRFSQVDASGSREKTGTGLGLAICQGLVERMGGRIWVESTLGQGSTFRFELPAEAAAAAPTSDAERPDERASA